MECILAQGVQAHLPPSQCQGFFSGLTKLSEDELKNGKGTMRIKDTGSLKVRTPTPVRARTRDNSGALAMPLCRGRNVAARAGRARGLRPRLLACHQVVRKDNGEFEVTFKPASDK